MSEWPRSARCRHRVGRGQWYGHGRHRGRRRRVGRARTRGWITRRRFGGRRGRSSWRGSPVSNVSGSVAAAGRRDRGAAARATVDAWLASRAVAHGRGGPTPERDRPHSACGRRAVLAWSASGTARDVPFRSVAARSRDRGAARRVAARRHARAWSRPARGSSTSSPLSAGERALVVETWNRTAVELPARRDRPRAVSRAGGRASRAHRARSGTAARLDVRRARSLVRRARRAADRRRRRHRPAGRARAWSARPRRSSPRSRSSRPAAPTCRSIRDHPMPSGSRSRSPTPARAVLVDLARAHAARWPRWRRARCSSTTRAGDAGVGPAARRARHAGRRSRT